MAEISLALFYLAKCNEHFLRIVAFHDDGIGVLLHQLANRPEFFVHRIDQYLGVDVSLVDVLDQFHAIGILQFQVDDGDVDVFLPEQKAA